MEEIIYTIIPLVVMVFMVLMVARIRKKGTAKVFDERQLIIRGKAYKYGFFSALAALAVLIFCNAVLSFDMLLFGAASCMFFGLTVFAVYCIWNDAFLSFKQKPSSYLLIGGIVIVVNGSGVVKRLVEGTEIAELLNDVFCLNILCAAAFMVIEITIAIKLIASRRENE